MAFKDWSELDRGGGLSLPINGKTYLVKSPPGRVGVRVQAFMGTIVDAARAQEQGKPIRLDTVALDDVAELDLYNDVLGATFTEMERDDVPMEAIKHAALTVMMWVAFDEDVARAVWEGKAPAAAVRNRGSSAGGNTTRSRTRGSGTSTRRASGRNRRRGGGSRGRNSSNSGR